MKQKDIEFGRESMSSYSKNKNWKNVSTALGAGGLAGAGLGGYLKSKPMIASSVAAAVLGGAGRSYFQRNEHKAINRLKKYYDIRRDEVVQDWTKEQKQKAGKKSHLRLEKVAVVFSAFAALAGGPAAQAVGATELISMVPAAEAVGQKLKVDLHQGIKKHLEDRMIQSDKDINFLKNIVPQEPVGTLSRAMSWLKSKGSDFGDWAKNRTKQNLSFNDRSTTGTASFFKRLKNVYVPKLKPIHTPGDLLNYPLDIIAYNAAGIAAPIQKSQTVIKDFKLDRAAEIAQDFLPRQTRLALAATDPTSTALNKAVAQRQLKRDALSMAKSVKNIVKGVSEFPGMENQLESGGGIRQLFNTVSNDPKVLEAHSKKIQSLLSETGKSITKIQSTIDSIPEMKAFISSTGKTTSDFAQEIYNNPKVLTDFADRFHGLAQSATNASATVGRAIDAIPGATRTMKLLGVSGGDFAKNIYKDPARLERAALAFERIVKNSVRGGKSMGLAGGALIAAGLVEKALHKRPMRASDSKIKEVASSGV